jgi:uncharacterized lipoprotein NlpE involved in copper resistance
MLTPLSTKEGQISKETVKEVETKAATEIEKSVPAAYKEIKGYYLKNAIKLNSETNFFILDSEKRFDEFLSKSHTAADVSVKPDFKRNMAVVIALQRSTAQYDIKLTGAYLIDSYAYVNYEISEMKNLQISYYSLSAKIFEIERPQILTNVCFSDPDKKTTVLPFGNRIEGSPSNLAEMLKDYTGIYRGIIPAADGPGIETVLHLLPDYSFNLKEIYLSNPDRVFQSYGKWAPASDLSSFTLNYDKDLKDQARYRFINKRMIEKLDIYGEKIDSELYKLKK